VRRVAVLSSVVLMMCAVPPSAAAVDLVVVRAPLDSAEEVCESCELVRIDADGRTTVLTPDFAAAKDPSVAFDGGTILFAGRRASSDPWHIWRIGSDGSNATRIIDDGGNATAPLHVGALFHLDDERPSERFVYLSDVHAWADPVTGAAGTALHAADLDGGNQRRISFNMGSDLAPDVLANGRLVYPSRRADGRFAVMAVNIDGTDLMAYTDAHVGPVHQNMVAAAVNRTYFISSDTPGPLGGGSLEYVSGRRPLRAREELASADEGWFHSPRPLADGGLLVSFLPTADESGYRLVRLDLQTGRRLSTVAAAEGFHLVDAQELAARPRVKGRSSVVDPAVETGIFYCISSHMSDRPQLRDAVRSATQLRVIEGIPSNSASTPVSPPARRSLGVLPVSDDGSFHIEVPASTPIAFELLDVEGRVVARQNDWVWVMPREWRGCIGCHEDREMVPPNVLADAVVRPAVRLHRPATEARVDAGGMP
jgi:hypothetical protein